MPPFYSCWSHHGHCPVNCPSHQQRHLSGPLVSWSGQPRRLHGQSAFAWLSSLKQINTGLASSRPVTRKDVGRTMHCQNPPASTCTVKNCCGKSHGKTLTLIISVSLLCLHNARLWTAMCCWLFHLVNINITVPHCFRAFQGFRIIFFILQRLKVMSGH